MAYKTEELEKTAIPIIGLSEGFNRINNKFDTELEFTKNLIPKLPQIIKEAYNLDVLTLREQLVFNHRSIGLYQIITDIFITTEQGIDLLIECKNPKNTKSELMIAMSQLMSYQFLMEITRKDVKIILATSYFEFFYIEFMQRFNLKYDLIINNKDTAAFWINDLQS